MFNEDLQNIASHIQKYCPYFDTFFADAWRDEEIGGVYASRVDAGGRRELIAIFPSDRFGNYFYLRTDKSAKLADNAAMFPMQCGERTGMMATVAVTLVAVARNVDERAFAASILAAVGRCKNTSVKPVALKWDREAITVDELEGLEDEDIDAALQNLSDQRIVSVRFDINSEIDFPAMGCQTHPCPC